MAYKTHAKYPYCKPVLLQSNINDYDELRKDGKLTFAYVGRHNYIKGYDLLINAFQQIDVNKVKVVCAGAQSNIEAPKSKNWVQ